MFRLIGWMCQGDLGDLTCYTSQRNNVIWFLKSPPKEPASPEQLTQRQFFIDAAAAWKALSAEMRERWNRASKAAHLRIHGYDLFTYWYVKGDWPALRTIERQTGIDLLGPTPPDLHIWGVPNH
jgi:hypothetical protein